MKINRHLLKLMSVSIFIGLTGCATNTPPVATSGVQKAVTVVPNLKVIADCGACQVRPTVAGLIAEGYKEAAMKSGAQVSLNSDAIVTIKEYSDRNDAARFLVGVFAGKDEIKATVSDQDKKFEVEDYYRNAWFGIESLSKKIGLMIFEKISPVTVNGAAPQIVADLKQERISPVLVAATANAVPKVATQTSTVLPIPDTKGSATNPAKPDTSASNPVNDVEKLPLSKEGREEYRQWLTKPLPRAFAVAANGVWLATWGTKPQNTALPSNPAERAMLACLNRAKEACKLYAVDNDVVWGVK